jgi:hypothetical protein
LTYHISKNKIGNRIPIYFIAINKNIQVWIFERLDIAREGFSTLTQIPYQAENTVNYAQTWALKRNPRFLNFDGMGGDCTSFASQCVFAGCGIMNFAPVYGWYYKSPEDRTASWSGVEYLYRFLISNHSSGPFAKETGPNGIQPGDLVQLGDKDGHFYHTLVVISLFAGELQVAAHTFDTKKRSLNSYSFSCLRCLHISGARQWK